MSTQEESAATPALHEIVLDGCAPTPLASYLKALGVLRIVANQADPAATGFWRDDTFHLTSRLDRATLVEFLLETYRPTPLLAPWGGRSGFYPGSSESSARAALERIEASDSERLGPFRQAIAEVRALLARHGIESKPSNDDAKLELLQLCRAELPDALLPWLDACYTLTTDGRAFPPLLGTGGNEGSGSYVSTFAQLVSACLIDRANDDALTASLFAEPRPDTGSGQTPGQFAPLAGGGPNATTGFSGGAIVNAWDFLLCLEGTLLFAAATTKRFEAATGGALAFPFTVRAVSAGAGSVGLGDEANTRAETWFPIWERPATRPELATVLNEGRVQVGGRTARDALDFARAVARLGLQRGITAFQRYSYMQRSGKNFIAVPIDRIAVRRNARGDLIDQLERGNWLERFRRVARGTSPPPPARVRMLVSRLENALFDLARAGQTWHVQEVLIRLGEAQTYLARSRSAHVAVPPVPRLKSEWVRDADDASPEFRIAAALAGLHAMGVAQDGTHQRTMRIMAHLAPLDAKAEDWAKDADHDAVWGPGPLIENLCALAGRRLLTAMRSMLADAPWMSTGTAPAELVAGFNEGHFDDARIAALFQGLALANIPKRLRDVDAATVPVPPAYALLKPLFTTHEQLVKAKLLAPADSRDQRMALAIRDAAAAARLLAAGRTDDAVRLAVRRLRVWGLPPLTRFEHTPHPDGRRLLAALLVPIPDDDLRRVVRRVARPREDRQPATSTPETEV